MGRVLSHFRDIEPDMEVTNQRSTSVFEKQEERINAIQLALGERSRRGLVAGALFVIVLIVAIIVAAVALQRTASNFKNHGDLTGELGSLDGKIETDLNKVKSLLRKEIKTERDRISPLETDLKNKAETSDIPSKSQIDQWIDDKIR